MLFFCHFYCNRNKVLKKRNTTQLSSTTTVASKHLCFITNTNLPHLYSGFEEICKIFDQLPEIHPFFRSEIEYYLGTVQGKISLYKFHFQTFLLNFLLAGFISIFLLLNVLIIMLYILLRSNS